MKVQFGPFFLDFDTRQLTREDRAIHLSPKALELLGTLVMDRPKVLSKTVLQQRLWPETFVAEANLSNLVAEVRGALDDRARAPLYIRTVHRFGYAFCGDAVTRPDVRDVRPSQPLCWLEWDRRRLPLTIGEHTIGRDPDVDVQLDRSTVSRRHARIVITSEEAVLEDLGSKNGTFRTHQRLISPVRLVDGDVIGIGSLLMTFHSRAGSMSTDTQVQAAP